MDRLRLIRTSCKYGVLLLIAGLGGCSWSEMMEPFQSEPTAPQPPPSYTADSQPTPYFTAISGLKLYAEPSAASQVLTRLGQHQKVLRYKQEKGYAYITVVGSGMTGWVDNGQLIWRLPTKPEPAASHTPVTKPKKPQSVPVDPVPKTQPEPEAKPVEAQVPPQTELPEQPAAQPPPQMEKPEPAPEPAPATVPGTMAPSIFNPF